MQNKSDSALRRLAVVLKDSNDAITVLDLHANIIAWNKGAEKLYGYTEDEALKMNVMDMIPDELKKEATECLYLIEHGQPINSFETKRVSKTGDLLDIWITVTCLRDDSGSIDSIATTERDITAIKNELRNKEKEVKVLMGLLPICASCKQIRDDKGSWHQIESYIRDNSEAEFSHGLCPTCAKKLFPKYYLDKEGGES